MTDIGERAEAGGPATLSGSSEHDPAARFAVLPTRDRPRAARAVATDLIEYLIVSIASVESLAEVVPALTELVSAGTLCILDAVAITRGPDGVVEIFEADSVAGLPELTGFQQDDAGLLNDRDLQLASLAIHPGSAALVLVTEDRWAQPLSAAAARAGGQIIAGERIPAVRLEAILAESRTARCGTEV